MRSTSASSYSQTETVQLKPRKEVPVKIVWRNVILFVYLHAAAIYGLYLMVFKAKLLTALFAYILYTLSGLGITAGAHRLWSHKTYTARLPLRIFLAICNSLAFQNSIFEWSRDHRVHHKFSETDADPHNAKRGFFFAHMGWLMCKKHPDVIEKGKTVDSSDLLQDPVVRIQKKYYLQSVLLISFVLPALVASLWGESYWNGFFVCTMLRYTFILHCTWLVNSAAHLWGDRPYDKGINPSENLSVIVLALGEGFHNYHHTFPWDYRTSEWGWKWNTTTTFINVCARLNLAYNLKTVSQNIVDKRRQTKGDQTEAWFNHDHTGHTIGHTIGHGPSERTVAHHN